MRNHWGCPISVRVARTRTYGEFVFPHRFSGAQLAWRHHLKQSIYVTTLDSNSWLGLIKERIRIQLGNPSHWHKTWTPFEHEKWASQILAPPQHGVRVRWNQEKHRTHPSTILFHCCGYITNIPAPYYLGHNEEGATFQACRWRSKFRRLPLQVVYYRGWVLPPQQTLRTRLPGNRSWSHNVIWSSSSLRWVRKVQRTYRLVWGSSLFFNPLLLSHIIGFGRP